MDDMTNDDGLDDVPEEVRELINKITRDFMSAIGPMMTPLTEKEKLEARIAIAKQISRQTGMDVPPDNVEVIDGHKFEM